MPHVYLTPQILTPFIPLLKREMRTDFEQGGFNLDNQENKNNSELKNSPDVDLHLEEVDETDEMPSQTDTDETTSTPIRSTEPESQQQSTLTEIHQTMLALQNLFDKQIARNQNQTQMFDKIYAEMKDYKESFLLEVLHKPIIHNLIHLYDSYVVLESQLDDIIIGKDENEILEELLQYRQNLENFRFKLEEVLYRMDVTPYQDFLETLDRHLHKTRKVIPSDDPQQDQKIVEVHKKGFNWRGKVFRPEEVTIYRYKSAKVKPETVRDEPSLDGAEDKTDG